MIVDHTWSRLSRFVLTLTALLLIVTLSACGGAATTTTETQPTAAPAEQPAAADPTEAAAPTEMATEAPQMTEMATEAPAAATAAAPAPAAEGKTTISFYTTSDTNITDWLQNTIIPAFVQQYPQYEVQVIDAGDAGTDPIINRAIAALQTGDDPQVDIMEGDPRGSQAAVDADLWYKPTAADVPNLANVVEAARVTELGAPYRGSQVVIAYNSEEVPENEVPKTYPDLLAWIKAHPGKFVYNRPDKGGSGGGFVNRAVYEASNDDASLWVNPFDQAKVDQYYPQAIKLLQEIHPFIYDEGAYPAGNNPALELFASGEVSMVAAWSDQALQGIARGVLPETTKLAQFTDLPMTGGYAHVSIPKNAANLKGAQDLLNFLLAAEQQASVVRDIGGFPAVGLETLPADLQEQFSGVITEEVPSWPGGEYQTALVKMWYEQVATNINPDE